MAENDDQRPKNRGIVRVGHGRSTPYLCDGGISQSVKIYHTQ